MSGHDNRCQSAALATMSACRHVHDRIVTDMLYITAWVDHVIIGDEDVQ